MTKKPGRHNLAEGYLRTSSRTKSLGNPRRQPFWLPAPNYYVLAAAIAIAVFFIVWGILHDTGETPWIPAGVLGSLVLIGAVVLREIVLRKRRNDLLSAQERLDQNLNNVLLRKPSQPNENKLTLEQNAELLKRIALKSDAANVLEKLSDAHWEVFELCDEYLHRIERELETVRPNSPRLAAINKGRERVKDLHKFHLLAWSSGESRELIQEAKTSVTITKKLEIAAKAQHVLESAVKFYPQESQLRESLSAVSEFIATIKVSHWIEQAERAAFKGNYKRAINSYRDALFYLTRENVSNDERDLIARKINIEIVKLKKNSEMQKRDSGFLPDGERFFEQE